MSLGQFVLDEIERLRKLPVEVMRALPSAAERQEEVGNSTVDVHTYRESSHDGRVVVIVKAFRQRFLSSMAAAEGFAITAEDQLVELDEEERGSLY